MIANKDTYGPAVERKNLTVSLQSATPKSITNVACSAKFYSAVSMRPLQRAALVPRAFLRRGKDGREKTLASAGHVIFKHPEKLGVIN